MKTLQLAIAALALLALPAFAADKKMSKACDKCCKDTGKECKTCCADAGKKCGVDCCKHEKAK